MNVMFVTSETYAKYALVMLQSLYENNRDEHIHVYIVSSEPLGETVSAFEEQAKKFNNKAHFIEVDEQRFEAMTFSNGVPRSTLFKLLVTDILTETIDRLLVIDLDIIIAKPIREFYYADFEGNSAIACEVIEELLNKSLYRSAKRENRHANIPQSEHRFNCGVILYNMEKLREDKFTFEDLQLAFQRMGNCSYQPDEMLFNAIYFHKTKRVNPLYYNLSVNSWRYFSQLPESEDPYFGSIVHYYGGHKPWSDYVFRERSELDDLWWNYAKRTPYLTQFEKEFGVVDKKKLSQLVNGLRSNNRVLVIWKAIAPGLLQSYLKTKGYQNIAIYGCNTIQDLLCYEFKNSEQIKVKYLIDPFNHGRKFDLEIQKSSECTFADIDAIIVADFYQYETINSLQNVPVPVLAFDEIMEELFPEDFYAPGV